MSNDLPTIAFRTLGRRIVEVDFAVEGAVGVVPVDCVLDLDTDNNVIGVEILNLKDQGGEHLLEGWAPTTRSTPPRWSYDSDVDAFYLTVTKGRSSDQRVVRGQLLINEAGGLVGLRAPLND